MTFLSSSGMTLPQPWQHQWEQGSCSRQPLSQHATASQRDHPRSLGWQRCRDYGHASLHNAKAVVDELGQRSFKLSIYPPLMGCFFPPQSVVLSSKCKLPDIPLDLMNPKLGRGRRVGGDHNLVFQQILPMILRLTQVGGAQF